MTIHSELKGDIVFTSHKIDGDVDSNRIKIDGNVEKGSGVQAEWGKIRGDIDDQTDLIELLGDYVTEEDFDRVKYVHVEGEDYPVIGLFATIEEGISGINIHLNDGTIDGKIIFLPDGMGVKTASNIIIAMIPTKVSQLTNDSGYITSVPVDSVNGKTGTVVLDSSDVGALPSNTVYVSSVNGNSGAVTVNVPTKTSDLTNDSGFITGVSWGQVTGKPSFATVATSGSYNDLSNKPTIPTVPTNISAFTNDSGYITGIDSSMVTTALGFTPYNSTNPNGYTSDSALTNADIDEVCV